MEKEKKQKILKICFYVVLALTLTAIITFCIVSAVYKDKKAKLDEQNKQIEQLLDNKPTDELFAKLIIND